MKAFRNKNYGRFKYFRRLVSAEIQKAKSSFYENKVCPELKSCPKAWWKQINRVIGKKTTKIKILNLETGHQMDDRSTANLINEFFANLTKDFPKVKDEWLDLQCSENLPLLSVEEVYEKLQKTNISKSPGPYDPFHEQVCSSVNRYFQ